MTGAGVPLAPSVRGQMAVYMANADWRCGALAHALATDKGLPCPNCRLTVGDYVRALDCVVWP